MRGLTHRWIEPKPLSAGHGSTGTDALEPLVRRILLARGLGDGVEARGFLDPRLTALHAPELMPDLEHAAHRLLEGARSGQRIAIYGDYDVDGIAASAILFHTLRMIEPGIDLPGPGGAPARLTTYVPHRLDEGYGLNAEALERLASEGVDVVVTVDCGVTAIAEAARARELGLDLIITDHHLARPDGVLPDCVGVVHPGRCGSGGEPTYPFADLCGAGVAFKLAWRLCVLAHGSDRLPEDQREVLLDLLALAGLATITDVVPLLGENRIIARFGLGRVKHTRLTGMRALLEASGLDGQHVGSEEAGFVIGPRLNACGRMGHAGLAVELLTSAGEERGAEIARLLESQNRERRQTERDIFDRACELAEVAGMTGGERRAIVLAEESWHPGVVGIVCSRLVGRYSRPSILMRRDASLCKGSGRSVDGFDLHAGLAACAEHLETFGGHQMAAGLSARTDRLERFVEAFTAHAGGAMSDDMLVPGLSIDCAGTLAELTPRCVEQLEKLAPFGRSNPAPSVLVRGVRIEGGQTMGANARHLKLDVREGGVAMRVVAWGWGERADALRRGREVDLVVRPKINEWNGRRTVEPELRDLRVAEPVSVGARA